MSDYIVLVKQVPDVSQITDNAFDPKTGNLIRTRLPSVINELDAQALAFAHRMKQLAGDDSARIICLTMGPPMAEEVLTYGLSRCADDAVLLTDRSLGGADTWATANPLSFAIRKIASEKLKSEDYYIIAGMQSVDGDTAQVPAQIAEEMKLPCIAYATDSEYDNASRTFLLTRIISGGSQAVRTKTKPAVITVAKYEYPLYATFSATRRAKAFELTTWTASDINATHTGVKGSKTRVIRVFPPGKTARKCQQISEIDKLAELIIKSSSGNGDGQTSNAEQEQKYVPPGKRQDLLDRSFEGTEKERNDFAALREELRLLNITNLSKIDDETTEKILSSDKVGFHKKALEDMLAGFRKTDTSHTGPIWVIAEHDADKVNNATFELTGKARQLAEGLDTRVGVCIAGDNVSRFADELIHAGADDVYVIEHPLLKDFDPVSYRKVISDAVEKYNPQIALFGATPRGRVLAPMVSYRLGCGLTADCTGLDIRDSSRQGQIGILFQTRPALGGNIMATIITKDSDCQMATARPGVMKRLPADPSRSGEVIRCDANITEDDISLEILKTEKAGGSVNFDADVIVAGGKGMADRDRFDSLISGLCEAVSEKTELTVEKGATRAAVEQGFAERIHQVGQTGTSVGPKLYIALGISGAIQHMIGVANTETIVAVNSDPDAPIFRQCDYYTVGKIEDIVPKLAEHIKAMQ